MKKIIALLFLTAVALIVLPGLTKSNEAKAQLVTTLVPTAAKDTLTNADTATIYVASSQAAAISGTVATDNITRSITAVVTKVSGTVAGAVYFYGSNDGTNWEAIPDQGTGAADSLDLSNVATNIMTFGIRNPNGDIQYRQYKLVFITSGTCVVIPKAYLHRRSN